MTPFAHATGRVHTGPLNCLFGPVTKHDSPVASRSRISGFLKGSTTRENNFLNNIGTQLRRGGLKSDFTASTIACSGSLRFPNLIAIDRHRLRNSCNEVSSLDFFVRLSLVG